MLQTMIDPLREPESYRDDPLIGQTIAGRYAIVSVLGSGGLGKVYEARHVALDRPVAVKLLHHELESREELRKRFEREAKALSALSHPNIVTVTDFGLHEGSLFIAMERLRGEALTDFLARGRPAPARALTIFRQILRALAYAHAQGVVHRDLKPANVFLCALDDEDHVEVLDFGLAKFVDETSAGDGALTQTGLILGTPAYMAPEQAGGGSSDARADVYASALILFELLTGRRVFDYQAPSELLRAHLIEPPPRLNQVCPTLHASDALEAFVQNALAKAPADRFADGSVMLQAFDDLDRLDAGASPGAATLSTKPGLHGPPSVAAPAGRAEVDATQPTMHGAQTNQATTLPTWPGLDPTSQAHATAQGPSVAEIAERRRAWLPLAIGMGLLVVLLIGGGTIAYQLSPSADSRADAASPEGDRPDTSTEAPVAEPEPKTPHADEAAAPTEAPDPMGPQGREPNVGPPPPWKRPIPAELEPAYRQIIAGGDPNRARREALGAYARKSRDDCRANLLLGYIYVDRGWLSNALEEYVKAYNKDSTCRSDPRMQDDLIAMAQTDTLTRRVSRSITTMYGVELKPKLEAARSRPSSPEGQLRIEALLRSIR